MTPAELRLMAFGLQPGPNSERHASSRDNAKVASVQAPVDVSLRSSRFVGLFFFTALMASSIGLIGGRAQVVAAWSPMSRLYAAIGLPVNLRGLEIASLRCNIDVDDGRKILTVEGELANVSGRDLALPELRLSIWGQKKEFYSWTTASPRSELRAGERIAFRTRLASPPEDAVDVIVQFARTAEPAKQNSKVRLGWLASIVQ